MPGAVEIEGEVVPAPVVDVDAAWNAHYRIRLEEDILRDFGPDAGGAEMSGSISNQEARARRIAEYIISRSKIPARSYFFQGSSSRSTFLTVSHSRLSDFDMVLMCDREWLRARGAEAFRDLADVMHEYVVSSIGPNDTHYMGRVLDKDANEFAFTQGRCGVELKVSVEPW